VIGADINEREAILLEAVTSGYLELDAAGRFWRQKPGGRVRAEVRGRGYLQIRRKIRGREYWAMAHRIVYRYFRGPIPDGLTINHKDGQKTNNAPENLETATCKEQIQHAIRVLNSHQRVRHGQNGSAHLMARLSASDVMDIRRARAAGQKLSTLAERYGVSFKHVSSIALGRRWAHLPVQAEEL
jgi:hypothetical protein